MGSGRDRGGARRGFTLMETMLAVTIIGVGVVAIVYAQRHFLYQNMWSSHAATATYLGSELRERMRTLPRHDRFSGGLYFVDPGNAETLTGWGPEEGEDDPADFDDIDDFSNAVFGGAADLPEWLIEEGFTRYPGPIDALALLIPHTNWDGSMQTVEVEGETVTVGMQGWTQVVRVQKVNPSDITTPVEPSATEVDASSSVVRAVDEYPLLVSVTLIYDGVDSANAPKITDVSWVVHP